MTDSPTKDERFNDVPELICGDVEAEMTPGGDCRLIRIVAMDELNLTEARALRDWLNKVLP